MSGGRLTRSANQTPKTAIPTTTTQQKKQRGNNAKVFLISMITWCNKTKFITNINC